jgi:glycolate oxidase
MWRTRQIMPEAFKALSPNQSGEDIVIPLAEIPNLMKQLEEMSRQYDVLMPCFAHAGDGNMHIHILSRPPMSTEAWKTTLPSILSDLYARVAALGGTLSGEHGIGHKRARYLPIVMESKVIDLQRRIKAAFDPNYILNPGKIFPDDLEMTSHGG